MHRKKKLKRLALRSTLRDAAAGIKKREDAQQQPNPAPRTKPGRGKAATSTSTAPKKQTHHADPRPGIMFANPEILGEPPEEDFHGVGPGETRAGPRYTGRCERSHEADDCPDPEAVKEMETDERAIWLGKWFGHHYAAWVSKFDMKELETYEVNPGTTRDTAVGPVAHLWWTFHRFRILEEEWRSPLFHPPFRLGLRRFRYEVVSTLRAHAIRVFGITDILTIDDRDASPQVTALGDDNAFLYAQGDADPMERYLRSDCIALRVVLLGPAAIGCCDDQKSPNVRAVLFNVHSIRDTLTAFVSTVLRFLLVDGTRFRAKGVAHNNSDFYEERMKSLERMQNELPEVYKMYKKFIDDNVFGEGEKELAHLDEEQKGFAEKFDVEFSAAKVKRQNRAEQENSPDSPDAPASRSGEDLD